MAQGKVTCPICIEDRKTTQILACPSCHNEVCHSCICNYAANVMGDMKCMNCNHPWDKVFIFKSLPPSVVTKLKEYRQRFLFDKEKAMLPLTTNLIPLMSQEEDLNKKKKEINDMIKHLKDELRAVDHELINCSAAKARIINAMTVGVGAVNANTNTEEQASKKAAINTVICPCPQNNCRGFVSSTNNACALCNTQICRRCHVVQTDDHECKPEDIASVDLIKKECKECPSCGVPSKKTEGCSQVWCIVCKKAWDWNTRKIEQGPIHATDYYHYMRANNIAIAPVCGRQADPAAALPALQRAFPDVFTTKVCETIFNRYRCAMEYRLYLNNIIQPTDNTDLRLKYLKQELDDKTFKMLLHKRDKQYHMNVEIHRIRAAYTQLMRDAITAVCTARHKDTLQAAISAQEEIHTMMVSEFNKLMQAFDSKRACPFQA